MPSCKIVILDEVNIKLEGLALDVRKKLVNRLKFEIPYARHMPQFKLGRWDGTVSFFGLGGTGYLNHLDIIVDELEKMNVEISGIDDRRQPVDFKFEQISEDFWGDTVWPPGHPIEGEKIRLKEHQVKAINTFFENPQSIQEIATSAGKTIITATMSKVCEAYGRTVTIVPNKSLVVQTEEDFINCGLDVGVYYGDRKELNKTHTICTWQGLAALEKKTLTGEANRLNEFLHGVQTVIIDEAHGGKAQSLKNILTKNLRNAPIRWGLTGTIPKEDFEFQALLSGIGPVVGKVTAKELQDKGIISNCHVNILQMDDDRTFDSYQEEMKYLVTDENRLEYMSKVVSKIKQDGNTLVLVDRVSAGKTLQEMIPGSVFVSGKDSNKNRKEAYDSINDGDNLVVIATYGVAAVGLNIPRIFNLVLVEPGKSFVRVIQSIGRGIRKAKDKDFVQIWDITSTCKFSKRHLGKRKSFYKDAQYPFTIEKVRWDD